MTKSARTSSAYAKRQKRHDDLEDRISLLPDELLEFILSKLTLKEAARTGVLSKRWRYMWMYDTSLCFDSSQTLIDLQLQRRSLKEERRKYVSWVNQAVRLHKSLTIDEFRVRFSLDRCNRYSINNWVNFAIQKRVRRLELDLSCHKGLSLINRYTFPNICCNTKVLRSRPLGFSSCNSLTTLRLKNLNVSGDVLEYFLSTCLALEQLYVEGSKSLVNLKVAGPSLRLRYLEIRYCFNVENLEISAKNLVSFKYFGPRICLPLKDTPQLVEMSIGGECCDFLLNNFWHLSSSLSQIESLVLEFNYYQEDIFPLKYFILNNIKRLELNISATDEDSLLGLSSLIEALPFLSEFVLQLTWSETSERRKAQRATKCSHQYLTVVELVGFVGRIVDVEFAMYLIENASMLEKIVFDTRTPLLIGTAFEFKETKVKRAARKRAKQLAAKLCPGVDLIII